MYPAPAQKRAARKTVALRFRAVGTGKDVGTMDADPTWTLMDVQSQLIQEQPYSPQTMLLLLDEAGNAVVTRTPHPLSMCLRVRDFPTTTVWTATGAGREIGEVHNAMQLYGRCVGAVTTDNAWSVAYDANTIHAKHMVAGHSHMMSPCRSVSCTDTLTSVDFKAASDVMWVVHSSKFHGVKLVRIARDNEAIRTHTCPVQFKTIVAASPDNVIGCDGHGECFDTHGMNVGCIPSSVWCTDASGNVVSVGADHMTWFAVDLDSADDKRVVYRQRAAIYHPSKARRVFAGADGGVVILYDGVDSGDPSFLVWYRVEADLETGVHKAVSVHTEHFGGKPCHLCVSVDRRLLAVVPETSGEAVVFDMRTAKSKRLLLGVGDVMAVSFADADRVLIASYKRSEPMCVWLGDAVAL
jgi:hypothetical protein